MSSQGGSEIGAGFALTAKRNNKRYVDPNVCSLRVLFCALVLGLPLLRRLHVSHFVLKKTCTIPFCACTWFENAQYDISCKNTA